MNKRNKSEAAANQLLKECRIMQPPVRVEMVAKNIGATIHYEPFEGDISGMVYRNKDRIIIGVNSLHHPNRQRFTIAHEIGHVLLHKGTEVHVDRAYRVNMRNNISSQAVDKDEIEANRFAAALLMPEHMLIDDLKGMEIDFESEDDLAELATKYEVSLKAMAIRLSNIGLISLQ